MAHLSCVLGAMIGMILHLVNVSILKRDMSRQTGCFQGTKSFQNLDIILKRGMTTFAKRLDPKVSHGSICLQANYSHVRNKRHVSLFKH